MTITPLTLTNPGAETGDTTGWTSRSGGVPNVLTSPGGGSPHSGTYAFVATSSGSTAKWDQSVDVSAHSTEIDAGTAAVKASAWHNGFSGDADSGALYVEACDGSNVLLIRSENSQSDPGAWTQELTYMVLPSGTRSVRIGTNNIRAGGTELSSYWDDFALEISDDFNTDYPAILNPKAYQLGAYALGQIPAAEARGTQYGAYSLGASETSTGLFLVKAFQLGAYALCKGKGDRVDLRAWTFLQDDHLFYGLQLGSGGTIVHDMLTVQWAQWSSPGFAYFRVEDAIDWEGFNLGCDTESGIIWEIDPTGRLDNGDTVITSQVTGQATVRFRRAVPCFMAELACSQAEPADETGTSIQLRTSDDATQSWIDHGTVDGEALGTATLFRWFGLGLMQAPGRIFELTNVGYARRIDGLDIEVGGNG